MSAIPIIHADELRALVGFEDLIEPVSAAFRETSGKLAENGLLVLRTGSTSESGDVYVKSGTLRGHKVFIVKVSPWFAANVAHNQTQGGFIASCWRARSAADSHPRTSPSPSSSGSAHRISSPRKFLLSAWAQAANPCLRQAQNPDGR